MVPRASDVEELLEWFEDVADSGVCHVVSVAEEDTTRLGVLHAFYKGLVEHPLYGGGWPPNLPAGRLAPQPADAPALEAPRMLWLGIRGSAEPISAAGQLVDQLEHIDQLGQRFSPEARSGQTSFDEFRGALEWRDVVGAGDALQQAFALLGGSSGNRLGDVAAVARVLHTAVTGVPLLADGGALGLDGAGLRTRALLASAWLQRLARELPVALVIEGADDAGPFLVELVDQLQGASTRVVIVLAGPSKTQTDRGNNDALPALSEAPGLDPWARAVALAQWGELERAITAAPVSTPWQRFVRAAWSSLAGGQADDLPAPLAVSAAGEFDAAKSRIVAGLLLAPHDSTRAAVLLRDGVEGLGPPSDDPHDDTHRVRIAAARGLLMVGDLDGVDEAVAGLLRLLPATAMKQLELLGEWRALPGVVARSVAAIENMHAIAILRALVPRSAALGHLLLARLELLERLGRLGTAADAASTAAEAVEAFEGAGPANRDELWRARRWTAWVAVRRGDPVAAGADLHELLNEQTEALGAQDPRTLSTSEWLARCLLEAGQVADALRRLEVLIAYRLLHGAPGDRDVVSAQHWLGVSLAKSDRHVEAAVPLTDVVAARARMLPADDEGLLASRQALGSALTNTSRFEEALVQLDEVVARRLLLDVPDAPRVVAARHSHASSLMIAGRHAEALGELDELVAIRTEQLEPDDPLLLHVRHDRAVCLLFAGRWQEALLDLDEVVARREQALGAGHVFVLIARHQRATCLRALGRPEDALAELNAVLARANSWSGDDAFRDTLRREIDELTLTA